MVVKYNDFHLSNDKVKTTMNCKAKNCNDILCYMYIWKKSSMLSSFRIDCALLDDTSNRVFIYKLWKVYSFGL